MTNGLDNRARRILSLLRMLAWAALLVRSGSIAAAREPTRSATSGPVRIAVVKSLDLPEYNLAYEGFVSKLTEIGYQVIGLPFTLDRDESASEATWGAVDDAHPDLILALGTRAAREAAGREKETPVIYSMVLTPPDGPASKLAFKSRNLTGATLNIPLATQLDEIIRAFPTARRIGIISDPNRTKAAVDSARQLITKRGLLLHVAWAGSEQQVPDAVRAVRDSIDVLWMIADETVVTPRSSRYIIFELIKAGIPVMGLSSAYVKAGALMALDCDYTDIGRQSGELAVRVLAGQAPSQLPHTAPRVFMRAVNMKIREHLRIPLDERIVKDTNVIIF